MQTHEWEALLAEVEEKYWDHTIQTSLALTEVVRLRRALKRLLDTWASPDDPADDYGRGMEAAYQIAADDLTRILEGDTDE